MKRRIKHLALASALFAAFTAEPALAHEDRSCFSQKTVSGWIKVCSERDGGFALNLGSYGDRHDHHDGAAVRAVPVAYYYPAGAYYFVPPGHYKHHFKHHSNNRRFHRGGKDRH